MKKSHLIATALALGLVLAGPARAHGGGVWFSGGDEDFHFSVAVPLGYGPAHYGHPWRRHYRPYRHHRRYHHSWRRDCYWHHGHRHCYRYRY